MKKIILHACCAPCSAYPVRKLISDGFEPVVFFYNPNIFPYKEYEIRRNELKNYCKALNIEFYEGSYDIKKFFDNTLKYKNEPEKGQRCGICFYLRLSKTAEFALSKGIDCFTTTLSVSPHKNFNQILVEAKKVEEKFNIKFLEYNFKKEDGFKISRQIARENNMYTQSYCGCKFSIR